MPSHCHLMGKDSATVCNSLRTLLAAGSTLSIPFHSPEKGSSKILPFVKLFSKTGVLINIKIVIGRCTISRLNIS
ncbi:hypothetical protein V6Z12_A07G043700 [Gossypium hirsutum]|uniref:Uncharacterized protein n=1 Tax=Gossypium tomentosum TaxID=34277 RepID=A0A5D2PMW6_GOSTO|nr:hypothetical protein ES332_A07G043200v1 [Gossypium tomentosum]